MDLFAEFNLNEASDRLAQACGWELKEIPEGGESEFWYVTPHERIINLDDYQPFSPKHILKVQERFKLAIVPRAVRCHGDVIVLWEVCTRMGLYKTSYRAETIQHAVSEWLIRYAETNRAINKSRYIDSDFGII